jgi:hypothetical protein
MRRTGIRGVVGLLVLLLIILSIGIAQVNKGFDGTRFAEETSEDDGDSDYGPTEMA